jgi:hypothetical protein
LEKASYTMTTMNAYKFRIHHGLTLCMTVIMSCALTSHAVAQSDAELRRENQQLRSQLDMAEARVAELEREVARLQQTIEVLRSRTDRDRPAADDEDVTIDESEPNASPRALMRALSKDYQEQLKDMPVGQADDRERQLYLRQLSRWQSAAIRKYRAQIQWHVRVLDATQTRSGYDLQLVAVDPKTDVRLGDPFAVSIPRGIARRYEQVTSRGDAGVLIVRGVLTPDITINPERQTSGPFDNPKLIGPFAEFRFSIDVRSLLPVGEEE